MIQRLDLPFLVEVCRYPSVRVMEAWEGAEAKSSDSHPSPLAKG
ncbi:MAG: hypothetical protein WA949_01710 [Phormidesmis sp.]